MADQVVPDRMDRDQCDRHIRRTHEGRGDVVDTATRTLRHTVHRMAVAMEHTVTLCTGHRTATAITTTTRITMDRRIRRTISMAAGCGLQHITTHDPAEEVYSLIFQSIFASVGSLL